MSPIPRCFDRTKAVRTLAAAALLGLLGAGTVSGDDRDLLRTGVGDPYLFLILDTSGSMNWAPPSVSPDTSCTSGDCYVPLQADDQTSKFFQAKAALYETLIDPTFPRANLGFATYNQDALTVTSKHWLYQAQADGFSLGGGEKYPANGAVDVFGFVPASNPCTNGGTGDYLVGCSFAKPASLSVAWEAARMQRLAKGGLTFTTVVDFFVKSSNGTSYRIRYTPVAGGTYGSNLSVDVFAWQCLSGSCTAGNGIQSTPLNGGAAKRITFKPLSDFLQWDNGGNVLSRTNPELTYFSSVINDSAEANTCNGWDPNNDTSSSPPGCPAGQCGFDNNSSSYNLRFPTVTPLDPRGSLFDVGDVIPFDWNTDHKADILKRLAPNNPSPPNAATADFRIATYLNNSRQGADSFLRLKDTNQRPLIAGGSTPIGNSFESFREWYVQWAARARDTSQTDYDRSFECRRKYLLILTDGDETCDGVKGPNNQSNDPCTVAAQLRALSAANPNLQVTVFVVAFGVQAASGNKLSCIADADHTFYPRTKAELVAALKSAIGLIVEDQRAFASAAVPSVQAEVADRIFLSSFRPIKSSSDNPDGFVWDGHLDAYLKPLPLANGKPDTSKACPAAGSPNRSSCHLWDAGTVVVGQAPTAASLPASPLTAASVLDQSVLRLGLNSTQRRVFYPKANGGSGIPSTLRLFYPPTIPGGGVTSDPDWTDLWLGLNPKSTAAATDAAKVKTIIKETLRIKTATVHPTGEPTKTITYVLGDIFHADPVLVDRPNDFFAFAANLKGSSGTTVNCTTDRGYRCFSQQERRRRKMLLVGADDGQLHAFDGGVWDSASQTFSDGTGTELFSYIPRIGMPIVRDQMVPTGSTPHQIFGVDGTPRLKDVFIDPSHNGTPTDADREWRTVAVGGFRDGGSVDGGGNVSDFVSGYYALDITQPDQLDASFNPIDGRVVPSCTSLTNQVVSGCGTLPFPSVLWEFTDSIGGSRLDEDLGTPAAGATAAVPDPDLSTIAPNGTADLAQTWSVPTIGRIKVIENGVTVDKFVAIFGGGVDVAHKSTFPQNPASGGTWLYMVDIETGQAIYKRQLVGQAPSDPAVLDVDLDGYLDTIYIGTTAGFLYKVDISQPVNLNTVTLTKNRFIPALAADQQVKRLDDAAWKPFKIFDTGGKPIYQAPTAFFVSRLDKFAIAFGTGDREALLTKDSLEGRFYLVVDDAYKPTTSGLPKHDSDYQQILPGDAPAADGVDYVLNPATDPGGDHSKDKARGWFFKLPANEKVITQAFGLSGIVIFSTFTPDDSPCANGGSSNIFVVFANNGNAVMNDTPTTGTGTGTGTTTGGSDGSGNPIRFRTVNTFVTNPYVEQGQTKNTPAGTNSINSEDLDAQQKAILNTLKKFYPKGTKFANYWISVSGVRADTGYERYATIPVGIVERNWKEH
ncbi:MAG TPA: hypothetical protein VF173_04770 [Thermoanaerobaculia bacterium]|nr:hypothetical protein [Thermoanaerobaculia bacterium]